VAFLLAGGFQGFWNAPSLIAPVIDAGSAMILALINIKFAMIVSHRV
jgi:hypothetical protein